jgi:hypothetical protein
MTKYWFKIGLGALLIFVVGLGVVRAARHVHDTIESNQDLTIPLGSFIPFKLDGAEIGKLRSLVIHRSSPKAVTGFDVNTRVTDSATFERLRDCRMSVTDATHFDEHSTFVCLKSDSGYRTFGEVRIDLRLPGSAGTQTLIQPLLLPESAIRDLERKAADSLGVPAAESLAAQIRGSTREQQRAYRDSIKAAVLEKSAKDMQRRADSIRSRNSVIPPRPPARP